MQLLKIEWLKIKNYRSFYILSGLFLTIYTLLNVAVNKGAFNLKTTVNNKETVNLISSDYGFPKVWDNMAYYFGWCVIFICVFVIINITNDYRFKTQRQHVIDGQSRLNYLYSKAILVLGISLALTTLYIFMCFIFGFINGGAGFMVSWKTILHVFLYAINYISFSALLSLFIKRSGLTIMLLLAFVFFEEIILALFKNFLDLDIARFSPLDCSDGLLAKPLDGVAKMMLEESVSQSVSTVMTIMSIFWVAVYFLVARWHIQKTDL